MAEKVYVYWRSVAENGALLSRCFGLRYTARALEADRFIEELAYHGIKGEIKYR